MTGIAQLRLPRHRWLQPSGGTGAIPTSDLTGLPQLPVAGLGAADAGAVLDGELTAPLDGWVRDQLVAETGGNPLALLEWPRASTTQQWTCAFGLPIAVRLPMALAAGMRRVDDLARAPVSFPTYAEILIYTAGQAARKLNPEIGWRTLYTA